MAEMGRPTDYTPEHCDAARRLTGNGKTLRDLAEHFDVAESTIGEWKRVHPDFSAAIELGREDASDAVERALFQRATGYTWDSEKIMAVGVGGGAAQIERVPIKEHVPPDVSAMKYWLGNRRGKDWAEKQQFEHSGSLTLEQLVSGVTKPPDDRA